MPQTGIILYLRPLRPVSSILARMSFHKFYFILEKKFAQITFNISKLDPWLDPTGNSPVPPTACIIEEGLVQISSNSGQEQSGNLVP